MEFLPPRFPQSPLKLIISRLGKSEYSFTQRFQFVLSRVRSFGLSESMEEYERRKLGIFNQLNFLQLITGILMPVFGLFNQKQLPAGAWVLACLPAMVSLMVLYLNRKHRHETALMAYFIFHPFVTCLVYMYGMNLGISLTFLLYGVLAVFFIRNIGYMLFSVCFSIISYFLLAVVLKQYNYQLHNLNYELYLFNEGLALVFMFYGLYVIKKENAGYQHRIVLHNEALKEKNVEIQIQTNQLRENAYLLEKQASELTELNTLKNKLFSVISHDLKAPMYALRNLFNNVLQNNTTARELKNSIPDVVNDLNYTVSLMDNLLHWAKSQMQADAVYPQEVNIAKSIDEVTHLLRLQASAKQIRLNNEAAEGVSGFVDQEMMKLVLRNLVSNAIKFTPQNGEISVGLREHPSFIEVYVKDNGAGISEEALQKINENAFYTSKGTASESGTGLGLMLCKEYIARNGGRLHIESIKGMGSTFSFSLPKVPAA